MMLAKLASSADERLSQTGFCECPSVARHPVASRRGPLPRRCTGSSGSRRSSREAPAHLQNPTRLHATFSYWTPAQLAQARHWLPASDQPFGYYKTGSRSSRIGLPSQGKRSRTLLPNRESLREARQDETLPSLTVERSAAAAASTQLPLPRLLATLLGPLAKAGLLSCLPSSCCCLLLPFGLWKTSPKMVNKEQIIIGAGLKLYWMC